MKKGLAILLIILLPAALLSAPPAFSLTDAAVLFVNVGSADAAIIRHEGQVILIDTGSRESAPKLLAALRSVGAKKVDALFLTHSHKDHVGGLPALKQAFSVDRVYCAGIGEKNKKGQHKTAAAAAKQGWEAVPLFFGDTVRIGTLEMEVLGPIEENASDDNDNSLVLKTDIGGASYLFTGDMQFAQEQTLLAAGVDLKADVLKVGNHGNRDATSPAFARAVSPSLAVISTDTTEDSNSAHPQVMKLLAPAAVKVTQQAALGIQTQVTEEGLTVSLLTLGAPTASDIGLQVDQSGQTVTLTGQGDLGGALLFSAQGGETFVFPAGTVLDGTLTAGAAGSGAGLIWPETDPIRVGKDDTISLFDRNGNLIAKGR